MTITAIRHIDWLVSWDASAGGHVYARNADLAFSPAGILHAGPDYCGPADRELSGRGRLVMPGLVNVHSHSGDEPIAKGVFDDVGTAALWGNALYEYSTLLNADADARAALLTVMLGELMLSGCTKIIDMACNHTDWLHVFALSGARG